MQLVKKFPAFHGTRRFITALTSVRHPSLSWASPIQSIYSHPTSWKSILILSTHLRLGLPSGLFHSGFTIKTIHPPHLYAPHAQPISFFSILLPAQYWVRSTNHLAPRYAICSISRCLIPLRSKHSPQNHVYNKSKINYCAYSSPSGTVSNNTYSRESENKFKMHVFFLISKSNNTR